MQCFASVLLFCSYHADVNVSAELHPPEGHVCLCYISEDCITHMQSLTLILLLLLTYQVLTLKRPLFRVWRNNQNVNVLASLVKCILVLTQCTRTRAHTQVCAAIFPRTLMLTPQYLPHLNTDS